MELDDLKASWQKMGADKAPVDEHSIKTIISQKSKSELGRIRKNMFLDIVAGVIIIIWALITIVYVRHSSLSVLGVVLLMILIIGWIGLAYPRLYKNSKKTSVSAGNLMNNLHNQIEHLEKDIQFYRNLNVYMYPLAIVVGLVLDQSALQAFKAELSTNYVPLLIVVLAFAIVFPLYVLFVKWWANFMYGRFVKRLKHMYEELITEEQEENL